LSDQATMLWRMTEHPKLTGDRSTLAVMLALTDAGFDVSVPFGENCRYDLVVDRGGVLSRVQCKSGRLRNGVVQFATASTYGHHLLHREARRDYRGQIDEFAVYCRDTRGVYLIPIEHVSAHTSAHLRIEPCRNGQRRGVRFASTYRVGTVGVGTSSAELVDADMIESR
jgi:PD-(D/E)XK endonuclease